MREVCHDVTTEPLLQPITGENLTGCCCNRQGNARLDVAASGFWGLGAQRAFFDVRVFNPSAPSHQSTSIHALFRRQEKEKRRQYEQRVREIERGSFAPLIFSTSGGMGPTASVVYKRLASLIAAKRKAPYSRTMTWVRAQLSFALTRSAIMCLRVSRGTRRQFDMSVVPPLDLVTRECHLDK